MMSVEGLRWAYEQHVSSPGAKAVLVALAWKADRDGYAWPAQTTLAEMVELDAGNVRRHVVELEAAGFVKRLPRARRSDGTYGGSLYHLQISQSSARSRAVDGRAVARGGPAREIAENQRALARDLDKDKRKDNYAAPHPGWFAESPVVDNGPAFTDEERDAYQRRVRELAKRFRDGAQ